MAGLALRLVVLLVALAGFAAAAPAQEYRSGEIAIERPWSRATPGNLRTGVAYLTVVNRGAATDRLIAAETPRAARVELHAHVMDGDVMRMRPIAGVEVHPGEPAVFQPSGLHLMLMELTAPLRQGERFPLTLTFEKAGRIDVEVAVEAVGARGAPGGHGGHRHGS